MDYLQRHIEKHRHDLDLFSYLPFFLKELGHNEEALSNYEALFAEDYRQDYDFKDYLDLLWQLGRKDEVFRLIEDYQKVEASEIIERYKITLLREQGKYDQAIEELKELYNQNWADEEITIELIRTYYDAGYYNEGLSFIADVLRDDPGNPDLYFYKGLNQIELEWYKEAKLSFEKCYEINPKDDEAKEYLDYVAGLLGQGDNSSIDKDIPAVIISPEFFEHEVAAGFDIYDAYYFYNITAIHYKYNQEYRQSSYIKVKIQANRGINRFSHFSYSFTPLSEEVNVNSLKVFDEHNQLKAQGSYDDYYITDDLNDYDGSSIKALNIPVPGLEIGDTVELVITRKKNSAPELFPYYSDCLSSYYPVLNSLCIVTGDIDRILSDEHHLEKPQTVKDSLVWKAPNAPSLMNEPLSLAVYEYLPMVMIGDKTKNWTKEAGDYLLNIQDSLIADTKVKEVMASLDLENMTDEEKIKRICNYIQQSYTYKAIEFGRRAWIPNKPGQTIRNKYGDCKDLSVLLHVLLGEAGISSYPALIHSDIQVSSVIEDIDQFNHMIVYLPDYKGGFFMDPTNKYYDMTTMVPIGLENKGALILDPSKPRLITVPEYNFPMLLDSQRAIEMTEKKELKIKEHIRLDKYTAAFLRAYLAQFDSNQHIYQMTDLLRSSYSDIMIENLEILNLDNQFEPVIFEMTYSLTRNLNEIDGQHLLKLPALWERYYSSYTPVDKRKTPFSLSLDLQMKSSMTLELPQEYEFASNQSWDKEDSNEFLSYKIQGDLSDGELKLTQFCTIEDNVYKASEYRGFIQEINAYLDALEKDVRLIRK